MPNVYYPTPWRHQPTPSLKPLQKQWLTRSGALTHALRALGPLTLRVLAEYADGATLEEASLMSCHARSPVWVREIAMDIEGRDCVIARSITPLAASHGTWQGMRRLRSRPLADILYDDPAITRSDFEIARLTRRASIFRAIKQTCETKVLPNELHARRSVFWRHGAPLLVAECFLPSFWTMLLESTQHDALQRLV